MRKTPVSPGKEKELLARMRAVNLRESDLTETHLKNNGIALLHEPSGTLVKSRESSSQSLNRFFARRTLVEELEALAQGRTRQEVKAELIREEKLRSGKIKRPRSTQVREVLNRFEVGQGIPMPAQLPGLKSSKDRG